MRMLTLNAFLHNATRPPPDNPVDVVRRRLGSTSRRDEHEDDVMEDELDPVDPLPHPPVRGRARRRFVNAGQTTYELSFSRRHGRAGGRLDAAAGAAMKVQSDGLDEHRPAPAVSSLSSVLTEVMTGTTKALNNIVDTTMPQPNVTYVVKLAGDGTPYVAASDGNKYFANSAIGQIFLKPVRNHETCQDERSESHRGQSRGSHPKHQYEEDPTRQSDSVETITTASSVSMIVAQTSTELVGKGGGDVDEGSKTLLGHTGFQLGKKKKGVATDLQALQEQDDSIHVAGTDAIAHQECDKEFAVLDPESASHRSRAASRWEVPLVKSNVRQDPELLETTEVTLLDSNGMQTANRARSDLLTDLAVGTDDSDVSGRNSSLRFGSFTNPISAPVNMLSQHQGDKGLPAPPSSVDAYDEGENPLCRSFQNVRNVDMVQFVSEDDQKHERDHDEGHECAAVAATDKPSDVASPDLAVNSPGLAGHVSVSSGATSVAEFVGGFKGQLTGRSGASSLVSRKRAVRHARLTVEEQKAAELARKIREAYNRIPLEFRDEYMSASAKDELEKKKDRLARGRRVDFNPDVLCREFEVESEDEDDGYDSPDEIVDAVQLVSKRDVVHAEDVFAAFSMERLELPSEETARGYEGRSLLEFGANVEGNRSEQNDPLTFSQLNNEKRLSVSDL